MNSTSGDDPRLFRLSPEDNIRVALQELKPGERILVEGQWLQVQDRIPAGHKVAIRPIAVGEKVIKYGCPIGSATQPIQPGQHVHTHNLQSDYLPS
ncbi:MAG: UxaA family hydrolase [Thermoguttaceae bacterium]|nr:UxaA family hydrolase [Thermoguttaceae bacterium]MDW8037830.1 UxaA family hydrolase [Thermoguttaceae bacterium]